MPDMLIFGLFEGDRVSVDIPIGASVGEVKDMMRAKFEINMQVVRKDNNILFLCYAGSDLDDSWIFTDLGIVPGTTIRVLIKPDIHPVLFVKCSHNGELVNIMDTPNISKMELPAFRSLVSKKTGLPIGVFRLMSAGHKEMYDPHILEDYDVKQGDTVVLETWNGWNEFLNLCRMGFSQQALDQITNDGEVNGRYQMKVGLFIAAHFGNVDLARCLLRLGLRSDEPIGEHPSRLWCRDMAHIETKKTPVHQATTMGQLGVLRLFINHDITVIMAKDGNDLTPLNIALRNRVKNCASFLLTKQWSKINVTKNFAVNITLYTRIKRWADKAKELAYMKYGQFKSTLKRRVIFDPLVSHGVLLDGYSESPMSSRAKATTRDRDRRRLRTDTENDYYSTDGAKSQSQLSIARSDKRSTPSQQMIARPDKRYRPQLNRPKLAFAGNERNESAMKSEVGEETVSRLSPDAQDSHDGKSPVKLPALRDRVTSLSTSHHVGKTGDKSGGKIAKLSTVKHTSVRRMDSKNSTYPPPNSGRTDKSKRMAATTQESVDDTVSDRRSASTAGRSEKKKKPMTSAMLISSAQTAEGAIPLPLVSSEKDSRPFFYLNGKREEDFIEPVFALVTRHKGGNSRDRAIASLSIANSFKDKPWLAQVRMAMFLTSRGIKSALPKPATQRKINPHRNLRKSKSANDVATLQRS